jgi:hypothetical protein
MKDDLPYFSHDNDSRNHPKMKALRARYGWTGYGQFWALNEMIAGSSFARLDLGRKVVRSATACELGMTTDALDDLLSFLSDPDECGLIHYENGVVTTDRTHENFDLIDKERTRKRGSGLISAENRHNSAEKVDNSAEPPRKKSTNKTKLKEIKQDEIKQDIRAPIFSEDSQDPIPEDEEVQTIAVDPTPIRPKSVYNPNDLSGAFETIRGYWNGKPGLPTFNRIFLNLFAEERESFVRMLTHGVDKLKTAVDNYSLVIDDPVRYGFDTRYAYKSLPGFLKAVEKYFDPPREAKQGKPLVENDNSKYDALMRVQE